ncbi:MAG TPA: MBL fold metallo-hydrolase [Vineibacter sp.]|nr:MBL fold metallo-hydrolase [Vineibacter sp.]
METSPAVRFLGCGDAFGNGGRYNTCFWVRRDPAPPFLIDCGASSLIAMKRFGVDPDAIGTVFLTHLHGDHFGGLVFLLREATLFRRRRAALTIAGPDGTEDRLRIALEAFFPGGWAVACDFDLRFVVLQPGTTARVDGVQVTPFPARHGSGAPSLSLRLDVDGHVIAYTGDTGWLDSLIEVGRDADLFICEAYTPDQAFPHHLGLSTVREKLAAIRPKRIILTHLGAELLKQRDSIDLPVAADGMTVSL